MGLSPLLLFQIVTVRIKTDVVLSSPIDSTSKSHSSNVGVAIIGAGFCGTMVAVHLLRSFLPQPTIALIDRNNSFGRGMAYGTTDPLHLLNVPAGKMGAFPDDPEHFWKWLQAQPETLDRQGLKGIDPESFIPRMVYGDYLETLLRDAEKATGRLTRFKEEALDVIPLSDGAFQIMLASGYRIEAEKVVLALGNFPPGDPLLRERRFHTSHFYLHTPWASATRELLSKPGDILILGSGLTALDLLLSLLRTKEEGMIHILSRHGLFPHPHKACPAYPSFLQANRLPTTARSLLREVRCEVAHGMEQGIDWRAVVDSLRPFNQALWQGFNLVERRRFMRHVRSYWEPHRHRAAPEALAVKETLESQGKLQCHRGRITQIAENTEGLHVAFQPLRAKSPEELDVHYLINCTGPECNYHKLKDPLIVQLLARGLIYPDPLLLGIDVDTNGIIHNVRGERVRNLHTLGSPQKGRLFETTAVPELCVQAKQLAQQILQELTCETGQPSQLHQHDPV